MVTIPDWLAAKHKQLLTVSQVASVASQCVRHDSQKDTDMNDRPADAGNGVLFRNDRREKPSQPEFKGEATIENKPYWVAAWVKEKNGQKFFSMAFRPKDEPAKPKPKPVAAAIDDLEIPFAPEFRG
jgi:hypothetical protein